MAAFRLAVVRRLREIVEGAEVLDVAGRPATP